MNGSTYSLKTLNVMALRLKKEMVASLPKDRLVNVAVKEIKIHSNGVSLVVIANVYNPETGRTTTHDRRMAL